jgi:cytochrome P450
MMDPPLGCLRDYTGRDPNPFYAAKSSTEPVAWDESEKAWIVTGFPECSHVVQHAEDIEIPWSHLPGGVEVLGRYALYNLSGAEHLGLHTFILRYFERAVVGSLRLRLAALTDEIFADLASKGRCDVYHDLAEILPGRAIMAVLGLPRDDRLRLELVEVNQTIKRWFESYGGATEAAAAVGARQQFAEKVLPLVLQRRDHPQDDLFSALWAEGRLRFADWNEDDMIGQALFLFGAGVESTANLILSMVRELALRPDIRVRLSEDRSLVSRFVEEVLRQWAPVHIRVREAVHDLQLGGVAISGGERILPVLAAANRDLRHFPNPNDLDLERPRPKNHLTFGIGARFCVGAPMARLEGNLVVEAILDHFQNLRLDPAAPEPRYEGHYFRAFKPMRILFDKALAI